MQYFYPCKPNRITLETLEIFDNPSWIAETKKNGWRAIIEKDNGGLTIWTRHHTLIKEPLSDIRAVCGNLPDGTMLDGELIFTRRVKGVPDRLYLFDLLYLDNQNFIQRPLEYRKATLIAVYQKYLLSDKIELAALTDTDKVKFYHQAINENEINEGIVIKKLDSLYLPSLTKCLDNPFWLKVKKPDPSEYYVTKRKELVSWNYAT